MTRLEVANMALNLIGGEPITTWGESTVNGSLASLHLPFAIKQVLRDAPWDDTINIVQIESTDQVDALYENIGYTYAYALPVNIFHLVEVEGKKTGWKYIDGVLHTNASNPTIVYQTEPAADSIPDDIGHAASFLLAFYMAPAISQDPKRGSLMLQQYSLIATNERQRTEQQLGDSNESPGWWTE